MTQLKEGEVQAQQGLAKANRLTAQMNKVLGGIGMSNLEVHNGGNSYSGQPINGVMTGQITNSLYTPSTEGGMPSNSFNVGSADNLNLQRRLLSKRRLAGVPTACGGSTQEDMNECNAYTGRLMSELKAGQTEMKLNLAKAQQLTTQMDSVLGGIGMKNDSITPVSMPASYPNADDFQNNGISSVQDALSAVAGPNAGVSVSMGPSSIAGRRLSLANGQCQTVGVLSPGPQTNASLHCWQYVEWVKRVGYNVFPDSFPNVTSTSSFEVVQLTLFQIQLASADLKNMLKCPMPCPVEYVDISYTIFPLPNKSSSKMAQRLGDVTKEQMSVIIQNQTYRHGKTYGFQVLAHDYDININNTALVPLDMADLQTGAGLPVWSWVAAVLVLLGILVAVVVGFNMMGKDKGAKKKKKEKTKRSIAIHAADEENANLMAPAPVQRVEARSVQVAAPVPFPAAAPTTLLQYSAPPGQYQTVAAGQSAFYPTAPSPGQYASMPTQTIQYAAPAPSMQQIPVTVQYAPIASNAPPVYAAPAAMSYPTEPVMGMRQ